MQEARTEDLRSMLPDELASVLSPLQLPGYRANQIFGWLQRQGAQNAAAMTNLPKDLRAQLDGYLIASCEILRRQESADGTVKYLFRLYDGSTVESVVMRYEHGRSVCVSTQAGCKMGCAFCASGANGFVRNLLAGEMLAQIHAAQNDACGGQAASLCSAQACGKPISHVVLMGMGEPLDNYGNTLQFLRLVSHPEGLNIGQRKISLSTCGLVPQIDRLAGERLGLTLSVSLHAPNDAIRDRLMPINRRYPLEELLAACRRYAEATGRRVSFEYVLFAGVNDSEACAGELARKLKGMQCNGTLHCHVNLIPANALPDREFRRSGSETIRAFQGILEKSGIAVTVRRSLGTDIDAACGQLRRQEPGMRGHAPDPLPDS